VTLQALQNFSSGPCLALLHVASFNFHCLWPTASLPALWFSHCGYSGSLNTTLTTKSMCAICFWRTDLNNSATWPDELCQILLLFRQFLNSCLHPSTGLRWALLQLLKLLLDVCKSNWITSINIGQDQRLKCQIWCTRNVLSGPLKTCTGNLNFCMGANIVVTRGIQTVVTYIYI